MLDHLECKGVLFLRFAQNCISWEHHMNSMRGTSPTTWEMVTASVMYYQTRPPVVDKDSDQMLINRWSQFITYIYSVDLVWKLIFWDNCCTHLATFHWYRCSSDIQPAIYRQLFGQWVLSASKYYYFNTVSFFCHQLHLLYIASHLRMSPPADSSTYYDYQYWNASSCKLYPYLAGMWVHLDLFQMSVSHVFSVAVLSFGAVELLLFIQVFSLCVCLLA